MKHLLWLLVVLIFGCAHSNSPSEILLHLHNIEREKHSATPLKSNIDLEIYAQNHAEWMAKNSKLKHSSLKGDFSRMGENIAMGQRNEHEVTQGWMRSPGHRRNILNKGYQFAGFGHAVSKNGTEYWCAVFGGN